MSQPTVLLPLHPLLQAQGETYWQQLIQQQGDVAADLSVDQINQVKRCFALSDFVAHSCIYQPSVFTGVFDAVFACISDKDMPDSQQFNHYQTKIQALSQAQTEQVFCQQIRLLRKMLMVHIAVLDLCELQSIEASYRRISVYCDALIMAAYHYAYQQVAAQFGKATHQNGEPMQLIIMAMGKLGGRELNFSSDIDLICSYSNGGQTSGGRRSIDNQVFFTKVTQKLIHYLHHPTADGFVFRVDMRLRPFGDSGPLVISFAAMEDYYQEQGRDWERYAMVKARVVNPEHIVPSQDIMQMLRPFVYRRYIDFSVLESLRKMKQLISQQARRSDHNINIKTGTGGIREVEFVVQALQLIRGGRITELQLGGLIPALDKLHESADLTTEQWQILQTNYLILRRCEHCLQQFEDKQTQELPSNPIHQQRLCDLFGQGTWTDFIQYIQQVMQNIHRQFLVFIAREQDAEQDTRLVQEYEVFWLQINEFTAEVVDTPSWLEFCDQVEAKQFIEQLATFKLDCLNRAMGQRGRAVMDLLIPVLIANLVEHQNRNETLKRVLNVISKIASRTAYLELLYENTGALNQLVKLCAQSQWIAQQLAHQPLLLDELIDPNALYQATAIENYQLELQENLIRVPEEDMEQQLDTLRHFKLSHQLRIAAADVTLNSDVELVSRHLTALAQAIFVQVVNIAWQQMRLKFGEPTGRSIQDKGFAVIAYGKMGSQELGYDSDLDVVFIHDCHQNQYTDGVKSIDSRQFYLKLCQRIVHIFTSRTASGVLYEIDNRLRPQGNSGLLACHIDTYRAYLHEEAWTWEHQALVRTRMIVGEPRLVKEFADIRRSVLQIPRDQQQLKIEVSKMRQKMRDHLVQKLTDADTFDLKQGVGGIADIEFITQYLVLAYGAKWEKLTETCHTEQLLTMLGEYGMLEQQQAQLLNQAYRKWRELCHRQSIQNQHKLISRQQSDKTVEYVESVKNIWFQIFVESRMEK